MNYDKQNRLATCDMDTKDRRNCAFAENISEEAAESAVKKVFAILGVNIDNPESVEEFREDLRFGRRLRKIANHGVLTLVGVATVALAAATWAGIVSKVKGS